VTVNVLFAGQAGSWDVYRPHLERACAEQGVRANIAPDLSPDTVDYIIFAPNGPVRDFTPYTRLRAVLSLWAGVEGIINNPTLNVPLARMVDAGLAQGMTEWVVGHVLRYHLGMDADIRGSGGVWKPRVPPLARERTVGILGIGELGGACATVLAELGFNVLGWSRRPRTLPEVDCLAGRDGLTEVLKRSEILVLLLPDTPATTNILCDETLALMPRGARILNPGRGPLIDDRALLAALDSGQIAHATLDVFRVEPLPPGHPYWAHPNVTVTPHIAAETRVESAAGVIARNLRRGIAGEPLMDLVDRMAGY